MIFNLSILSVTLASMALVMHYGNSSHHEDAQSVVHYATGLIGFLLFSRLILSEKMKLSWKLYSLAAVPLAVYMLLNSILMRTGGSGAPG